MILHILTDDRDRCPWIKDVRFTTIINNICQKIWRALENHPARRKLGFGCYSTLEVSLHVYLYPNSGRDTLFLKREIYLQQFISYWNGLRSYWNEGTEHNKPDNCY